MDVGDWLRSLGLSQYEAAFRENAIDGKVLLKLTAGDLKDLGVASVGHRRTMLSAIEALSAALSPQASHGEAPPAPPLPEAPPSRRDAERRHLAVLFCDLVGSTGISAALDVEDWRDLAGSYLDAAPKAVTEMGGHVAKKLGDGIMALFGHPIAQENDAERAVRAALAIQRALAESTLKTYEADLNRRLDRLMRLNPTDKPGRRIQKIIRKVRRHLFVFVTNRDLEATNNGSERALRPSAVYRKITNGFRSQWGAKLYADIRSVVETARRRSIRAIDAIRLTLQGKPIPRPA